VIHLNDYPVIISKLDDLTGTIMGHLNWKGEWIPDESPFDRASEYSLKQDLIKDLLKIAGKYQGRIKDKAIAEAAMEVVKKYKSDN
jgi:hypothetical protein